MRGQAYKNRFNVLERDGFTCQYCGARAPAVVLHVDHVVPVSRGGVNDASNLTTACSACNVGKAGASLRAAEDPTPPIGRLFGALATYASRHGLNNYQQYEALGIFLSLVESDVPMDVVESFAKVAPPFSRGDFHASAFAIADEHGVA